MAGRLHVLHVLTHSPRRAHGGIETYVDTIARHQRGLGVAPTLMVTSPDIASATPARVVDGEVEVPARSPLELLLECGRQTGAVADAIAAASCDLVHVHHWHHLASDLVRTARSLGLPVVLTLHDFFAVCPMFFRLRGTDLCDVDVDLETCTACVAAEAGVEPERLRDAMRSWSRDMAAEVAAAQRVFALSTTQRDHLAQLPRLSGADIDVLDLAPPAAPRLASTATAAAPGDGPLRLVTWGGLVPGKGLGLLLEACARLPFAVEVDHYGRLVDEAFAESLRDAAKVPLRLHGQFDTAAVAAELAAFDLAVFPSLFVETYGYTVDEAMQLGLPVVVADRGAPAERVGARGLTFRAGDAGDLAAALTAAREQLAELRAGAPRWLATEQSHTTALVAAYREVMSIAGG